MSTCSLQTNFMCFIKNFIISFHVFIVCKQMNIINELFCLYQEIHSYACFDEKSIEEKKKNERD